MSVLPIMIVGVMTMILDIVNSEIIRVMGAVFQLGLYSICWVKHDYYKTGTSDDVGGYEEDNCDY